MAEHDDDTFEQELRKRWDPEKLSRFLKMREGKAQRLDMATRQKYERRFGVDLGDVRIYTGTLAEEITAAHDAEALTVANTGMVLMGNQSKYSPHTPAGEALLAHELTHVAQAKPATVQRKGVSSAPLATEESEREAEEVEAQVFEEQRGGGGDGGGGGGGDGGMSKAQKARDLRDKLTEKVMQMFHDERLIGHLRSGGGRGGG
jgi:hypothetical protein